MGFERKRPKDIELASIYNIIAPISLDDYYDLRRIHKKCKSEWPNINIPLKTVEAVQKVTRKEYKDICGIFNDLIIDKVISGTAERLRLPYGIGEIYITKNKITTKNKRIHRKLSTPQEPVYFTNTHTNFTFYRFKFRQGRVKNIKILKFDTARVAARKLHDWISAGNPLNVLAN